MADKILPEEPSVLPWAPTPEDLTPYSEQEEARTGITQEGIGPGRWDRFKLEVEASVENTTVGVPWLAEGWGTRKIREADAAQKSRIWQEQKSTPEELNKKYPGMPQPFTEAEYDSVAKIRWDYNEYRKDRELRISRAAHTSSTYNFFTGLAAGMPAALDPANIFVGAATGGASVALGIARTVPIIFAENLVGNLATEAVVQKLRYDSGQDVDLDEGLKTVVGSSIFGTALHVGGQKAIRAYKKFKAKSKILDDMTPLSEQKAMVQEGMGQHLNGNRIDTTKPMAELSARNSGDVAPDFADAARYEFREITHPSQREFYVSIDADNDAQVRLNMFGEGVHLTDNKNIARNMTGAGSSAFDGKVITYDVSPDAKVIDLDTSVKENVSLVESVIKKLGLSEKDAATLLNESDTILNFLGKAAAVHDVDSISKSLTESLKEAGFDGYRSKSYQFSPDGVEKGVSNSLVITNEDVLVKTNEQIAEKHLIPEVDPRNNQAYVDRLNQKESNKYFDAEAHERIERAGSENLGARNEIQEADLISREQQAKIATYADAKADPMVQMELEKIEAKYREDTTVFNKAFSAFAECLKRAFSK